MVPSRKNCNVGEVRSAWKKRQLNGSSQDEPPKERVRGLRASLGERFRRHGALQRTPSTGSPAVVEAKVSENVLREARFMNDLPLRAPYIPEVVCGGCGKAGCECDPESDDEEEPEEAPRPWYRAKLEVVSERSGRIVNDQRFEIFIVVLITINSLLIGVFTFDFVEDNPNAFAAFRILDLGFLTIFTIELMLQFLYHGYNLFFDGWLLFDLFIVVMSWALESISVLRSMRLRSLRILRAFRLTTKIRILRRLVEAIFDVLPKISAIICMFCLIIYIFGVMCTELFRTIDFTNRFVDDPLAGTYAYFTNLDDSLFTLFVMMTLDWAKVTRAVMQVYPWSKVIFATFVTFSSFVLYNLVVAVVCDAVKMVQDQQDILMVENYVKDKIESRHRIINLRQKLDKMSKQQMDLLLYVQLLLDQVVDIDEASKQHYEETLLQISQTNQGARDALTQAIQQLDAFEKEFGLNAMNFQPKALGEEKNYFERAEIKPVSVTSFVHPQEPRNVQRRRRVSFNEIMIGIIPEALLPAKETGGGRPDGLALNSECSAASHGVEIVSTTSSRVDDKQRGSLTDVPHQR